MAELPHPKRVLVTGATGFIGPKLVRRLLARGDRVVALVRNVDKAQGVLGPAPDLITNLTALPDTAPIDAIVNLAGEPIAGGLWTARRRALLLESRLGVTRALLALVARLTTKPSTWVNASAIGYYGSHEGDARLDERTPSGSGFQAELCRRWEETAAEAGQYGVSVAVLRLGIVLGRDGGALPALARPVRLFAGTVLGSGQQWTSWIHIDDLLGLLLLVLDRETLSGPINATAPAPVRHGALMKAIATTVHRPLWPVRVPAPLLRATLGELAELFVDGQRVIPERAIALGYRFSHADIDAALSNLLGAARLVAHHRRASTSTRGACLCGAVTFAIAAPYRWFAHCHCSMCRKHHGTLFSSGLGVAREQLHWLGGSEDVVHYRASAAFERPFCRHCGSTVPAVSHDEGFWHVPAGLLDGDPGIRPRSHIFVASKSPLYELDDALPQHAAYPPGIELPLVERRRQPLSAAPIGGSCLCGNIAFSVSTTPGCVVNCYCSLCRRRSGGAFTSTLLTTAANFRWLRGETLTRRYALPAPRQYSTHFCVDCGSAVPSATANQPSVMLPAGAIDSELPSLPAVHLYVGSKAQWYAITDDWPQFAELPPPDRFEEFFQ